MKSEEFTSRDGLRQGGVTLFTIFMDDFIKVYKRRTKTLSLRFRNLQKVQIGNCAFSDDILIIRKYKISINLTLYGIKNYN